MEIPLIATKLLVPRPRGDVIRRQRLHDLLERGARSRVTLISASAGFGKTTLLVDWLTTRKASDRSVAWVSLEPTDNEPAGFWSHLIAALRQAAAPLGNEVPLLADQVPDRSTTVALLNALAALSGELDVVLDDLHFIEDSAVLEELAFFIDHLSENIHLVISTRADPALPIARLRARGELIEIRSNELRFRPDEAASYFADAAHLSLGASEVEKLEERTEGWIAALQLAALSMRGRADRAEFVANFAGSDRYVVDYLVEEVLRNQSEGVRRFLFGTAMLGRFTGALCDAVLETQGNGATIEGLDAQNLFIVPLDDRRQWYRYHHLFADVLLAHMPKTERDRLAERHSKASLWFEANGDRDEAIRHALAASDFELAATLIERAVPEMRRRRRVSQLQEAIEALPDALVRARPALSINLVGPLLTAGITEGIEERLSEAEAQLKDANDSVRGAFMSAIELFRSALAQMRGDLPAAITHAQRIFDLASPSAQLERAGAAGFLAIVAWSQGQLVEAQRHWAACTDGLLHVGYVADAVHTFYAQGQIALALGRLADAEALLRRGLSIASQRRGYPLPGSADLHVGLAEIALERNDLAAAHARLTESEDGGFAGMPQYPSRKLAIAARIAAAEGDLGEAMVLLDEAARLHVADFFPNIRPIGAMRARLSILQQDWPAVERWERESGIRADQPLIYSGEYGQITLVRLLLAKGEAQAAMPLLERLVPFAESGGRLGVLSELSMLRAIACEAMGDASTAQSAFRDAISGAERSGLVRIFLDEGERIAPLLRAAAKGKTASPFARKLLADLGAAQPLRPPTHSELLEPLSDRELDVLRLLRGELSGPDIASELRVSLNTVRTHTKNIYEKLGVNSRRTAVRRAEEMNLLRRDRPA